MILTLHRRENPCHLLQSQNPPTSPNNFEGRALFSLSVQRTQVRGLSPPENKTGVNWTDKSPTDWGGRWKGRDQEQSQGLLL